MHQKFIAGTWAAGSSVIRNINREALDIIEVSAEATIIKITA